MHVTIYIWYSKLKNKELKKNLSKPSCIKSNNRNRKKKIVHSTMDSESTSNPF